jgi:hypothetical protein
MTGSAVRGLAARRARREDGGPRLGRGVVTAVAGGEITVALDDGSEVRAELALALPYAACEGDVLLVIGQGGEHFVIGVLSGQGRTSLRIQGDVSLHAVGGALDLSGDQGVRIHAPSVEVETGALRTVAHSVVQTFATLFQRVSEALSVHAKQSVTIVEEGAYTQARTAAIQTEGTVTINGKEIHLG